jgi:N utilization substance protein B
MLRPETKSRARALQLLYAWETRGRPPLDALVPGLARMTGPEPRLLDGAEALAQAVVDAVADLDQRIGAAALHWRLDRIGLPERLVLRLGTYELLRGEVPPRVAIDEALWLTRRFADEGAVPFVNGILDRIGRETGRL